MDAPETSQFLSDRFNAAVTWTLPDPFRLAYIVRAVTPGVFRHPAAHVEDMYRPAYRGWSDRGEVRVVLLTLTLFCIALGRDRLGVFRP